MFLLQVEVMLFLILLNGQMVSLSILYPIVAGKDLSELPPNDDSSSAEIPIKTTFPYFDKNYNSLFVSSSLRLRVSAHKHLSIDQL